MTPDEWALDFYDRYVARQGGSVAQEKIRDAMGVAYSDAVDTGVIAPEVVTPYEADPAGSQAQVEQSPRGRRASAGRVER